MEKIKSEGLKSYNIRKMLDDSNYFALNIPSVKLRTFMNSDYSKLVELYGESTD